MKTTFRQVEERLRSIAPRRDVPITLDTQLYGDLGLYGDDMAFDVVIWATREHGVSEGFFRLGDYCPGEGNFTWLRIRFARLFGVQQRQYKSFTVRDLVSAIESKRWPDTSN
jgi:hypothetical protein